MRALSRFGLSALTVAAAAMFMGAGAAAKELELRSTGGAYIGKYKYDRISPSDALISLSTDGRELNGVSAGFVANNVYLEVWQFENGRMIYSQLPASHVYRVEDFAADRVSRFFCTEPGGVACKVLGVERLSKRLITVTIQNFSENRVCGGAVYVDEEGSDSDVSYAFGNFQIRSFYCLDPGQKDAQEALALAVHYLDSIRKDARRIAFIRQFDLPKPAKLPAAAKQESSAGGKRTPASEQLLFDVKYLWTGQDVAAEGTLTASSAGTEGTLEARMTPPLGTCRGVWSFRGHQSGSARLPHGVWELACENNFGATGNYRMTSQTTGVGRGTDSRGRAVEFNFAR